MVACLRSRRNSAVSIRSIASRNLQSVQQMLRDLGINGEVLPMTDISWSARPRGTAR